ncbi:MAG: type II toxin-antitoxin system YhaV family toxin [Oxalobacteraceae bacterium]
MNAVVNGWSLFLHPLLLEQVTQLRKEVEKLREKDPVGYTNKNASKRLAAITRLIYEIIPQDPGRAEYRQGLTLGGEHKHWFRAKFFQQYRLFFRFHTNAKIIVYAWVNDETTLRAYNRKDDAYHVFKKMLDSGNPPGSWDELLAQSRP